MRLVYESTGAEVKVGDMVKRTRGDLTAEFRVDFFRKPHKPDSSGKVVVMAPDGGTAEFYVGAIGAEWIEREDRGEAPAPPLMRNGKPLKTLPDGAPRRMADGKNAWRKMSDEQRFEFLRWITHGDDAPVTDAAHEIMGHAAPSLGKRLIGEK